MAGTTSTTNVAMTVAEQAGLTAILSPAPNLFTFLDTLFGTIIVNDAKAAEQRGAIPSNPKMVVSVLRADYDLLVAAAKANGANFPILYAMMGGIESLLGSNSARSANNLGNTQNFPVEIQVTTA